MSIAMNVPIPAPKIGIGVFVRGQVSAFVEHLGISVRRTVKLIWIEYAGKMEGAFRRLEFSPRMAKSIGWHVVFWGCVSVR